MALENLYPYSDFEYVKQHTTASYLKDLVNTKRTSAYFFVCTVNADGTGWEQKSFSKKQINEALEYIEDKKRKRAFVTTCLFDSRNRIEEEIGQIRKITIDLDIYNSKYKDMPVSEVADLIEETKFKTNEIPFANEIGFSGGGIYLTWDFKYTPGGKTLSKRRVIAKILYEMLREFGPDAKALDPAHVFAIPETHNWKYDSAPVVHIYRNNLAPYTLAGLARALPSLWDVWKKEKKIEPTKEKKYNSNKISKITPIHKERTLAFDHIISLKQLILARNGEMEGYREAALFFVRNAYHKMHLKRFYEQDEELFMESYKLACEVNEMFTTPLKDLEVRKQTLNKKKLYNFKTETIVNWFDISLDEQIQMKVKTKKAKNEKSKRQMRQLRGSVTREEYLSKSQKEKGIKLKENGLKYKQIADELNVSIDTVKGWFRTKK